MFEKLFESARIGDLSLKNRIVMAPMESRLAEEDGTVGNRLIDYYAARARAGVGLVVVEVTAIDPEWGFTPLRQTRVDEDRFIAGLSRLAAVIHAGGATACIQLGHPGASGYSNRDRSAVSVAPSAIPFFPQGPIPRELSKTEIAGLVEAFGRGAKRAQLAGFDAVEIHAAHGYLLSEFLAPLSNRREDEYGGNVQGRARFTLEALAAVKRECGRGYPVVVRLSAEEEEGGITPEDTTVVARMLAEQGADAISVSRGSGRSSKAWIIPPAEYPEGVHLHLATEIKRVVKVPVIGVGRINTPAFAEKALKEGKADFLALGRALVADPEWVDKTATRREAEIVPCLGCNRCSGGVSSGTPMICTVNPAVGLEAEFAITAAQTKKKVVIVGGGPGGMEAARVAALRGHEVTLYEKAGELGGQLIVGSKPAHKEDIERLRSYYVGEMGRRGVRVDLGCEFTPETAEKVKPDAVVVAAGASPLIPEIPGVRGQHVVTAEQALAGAPVGEKVIIVGGQSTACETAEFLAAAGKSVTVVRRGDKFATDLAAPVRSLLQRRLRAAGVVLMGGVRSYEEITESGLVLVDGKGERVALPADTIVLAAGMRQRDSLSREIAGKVAELYSVGDCVEPRDIMAAVREGAIAGRSV